MTGFYTFKWERPASEVYVTGTFDGWSRSTRLEKADSGFVKKVELPVENILYKFIVDGNWIVDPDAPIETEPSGVQNSILFATKIEQSETEVPEPIIETPEPIIETPEAIIETVAPESTTVALAAEVPKESEESEPVTISPVTPELNTELAADIPKEEVEEIFISSVAPESTTTELAAAITIPTPTPKAEEQVFSVSPIPASVPKEEEQVFSINPLPASETAENPITLLPDEPVPEDIGTQSLTTNVKLDKESYEQGATNFPVGMPNLADVTSENPIPESSLAITSAVETAIQKDAEVAELPQSPAADSATSLEESVPETPTVEPIVNAKKIEEEEPHQVFLQTRTLTIKTNIAPDTTAPMTPASLEHKDTPEKPIAIPHDLIKTQLPPTPTESFFGHTNRSSVQSQSSSLSSGKKSINSNGKPKHRGFFGALREKLHLGRRKSSS